MLTLSLVHWCWIGAAIFLAGVARGATGFGFSLIASVLLTMLLPPVMAVPAILLWEIAASIGHLPFIYRQVDWNALGLLSAGMLLGTPLGVWLLRALPPAPMCLLINGTVLVLALLLLYNVRPRRALSRAETAGVGLAGGLLNGASANGGPPVILFFMAGPSGAAVGRASLIAYFLLTDSWAALLCLQQGLFTAATGALALYMLPPLGLGVYLGSRLFRRLDETRFRKLVLGLLLLLAGAGLLRTLL